MTSEEINEDLSGHLYIKTTNTSKIKNNKKQYWVELNTQHNELHCFKNNKEKQSPIEKLVLYGAGISFGKASENEFIINIRGCEYKCYAESHKLMVKWANVLKKQITMKPLNSESRALDVVPEDEILEVKDIKVENFKIEDKKKQGNFFNRLFNRISMRSTPKINTPDTISKNKKVVKPAPLRTVVGSMQDISNKPVTCSTCQSFQARNIYLTEQVSHLNEDIENLKDQMRTHARCTGIMERKQIHLKIEFVQFLQNSLVNDTNLYVSVADVPSSRLVFKLLQEEHAKDQSIPCFDNDYITNPHVDHLGFLHLKSEGPIETLLYLCEILKIAMSSQLQADDEQYQRWLLFSAHCKSKTYILDDPDLADLIQYGIPHQFRAQIWRQLIENHVANIQVEKGGDYYLKLVDRLSDIQKIETEDDEPIEKQIKIDLLRTMPMHQDFRALDQPKVATLHRILRAFLLHNKDVGYCQGMNFMVAFGLLYLDEETAFWLLVAITEVYFPKHHYNLYLSGTQASQRVFSHLCEELNPELIRHLESLNCELAPITFNWFMTIFFDALPVNVVLNIWDCFLFYGHKILYPFALTLIKLQKKKILSCKETLSAMRKLKAFGKMFYDVESLLKEVFERNFQKDFNLYNDLYVKYLKDIEEESLKRKLEDEEYEKKKQKLKFTPKPMMVSVAENLDELDDDLIIKCVQCEENHNYVWILGTSDLKGQVFVLNVSSRTTVPIDWQVDCRCIAMCRLETCNIMLVSTMKSMLHAIDIETKKEIWSVQLAGCALSISCDMHGNVALTLMDGTIAFFNLMSQSDIEVEPSYIDISSSPVFTGCIVGDSFWCGAANKIVVMEMKTLETKISLRICPRERHTVSQLVLTDIGVWCSVISSSVVHLWDKVNYYCLLTVDILVECGLASEKKTSQKGDLGITTIMAFRDKLWVGFGNGRFIINDVFIKNTEDDLNDVISHFKSIPQNTLGIPTTRSKLSVNTCCHDIEGDNEFLEETRSRSQSTSYREFGGVRSSQIDIDSHVEYSVKMNQIQRVSENRVSCFIPCRNDNRLVLSCMGALNDDSSVILWSSEKHDGREMWFAQTVSYSL
ncbi:TBC1 domain family member 2B isoform X3 [Hydra vulgaris]|uniref:TBC1 domain family member 2B isoform X3 n=1 Tax=Hydra vulgaris TaxID=6087 RepID=A0ABM4BDZ7_HYDVU